MSYVIDRVVERGAAVKEFHIRRADGGALPDWPPGAHVVLQFSSADGSAYENHYSLIGVPGPAAIYRIAVQRDAGGKGGSRCLHDEFGAGSRLGMLGPINGFPLDAAVPGVSARVVLIAGGIGITPMISMAHALLAAGVPFVLHYLVRDADGLALMDELGAIPPDRIVVHRSRESGRADPGELLGVYGAGDRCYACGPAGLLQAVADAGAHLGWPPGALRFESFGARVQQQDGALTVELSLSRMTVEVRPGTSILDALIAAGAFVSYECKRGECGSCYALVEEGQPLHRDVCLTLAMRAEGMCTCVSWAEPGRLVLEL